MDFEFTQLGADTFNRADENPLNPADWTNLFGGADRLEIVSDKCVITLTSDEDGAGQFIAVPTPPNDQYAEYTVVDLNAETGGYLYVRWASATLATYRFTFSGPFNDNTGGAAFIVDETNAAGSAVVYSWTDPDNGVPINIQEGDVLSFGVIGTKANGGHLYVFQNRNLIWTGNLADDTTAGIASGMTGIQLFSGEDVQTQFGIAVTNFAVGSLAIAPTNTISGSLGTSGAGARVFFVETASGNFNQQNDATVADSNGNFTSGGLDQNAQYLVIPVLYGEEFSPFSQTVNLVTTDITGINWTGAPSLYHFVQGYSDTMNRGGVTKNPIDNGWTKAVGSGYLDLQIVGDACEGTVLDSACDSYASYTPPADCFLQYTIAACVDDQQLFVLTGRTGTQAGFSGVGYQLEGFGGVGIANDASFQIAGIAENNPLFSSPGFADEQMPSYTLELGDVFTIVMRANNQYIFRNSVPIGASTSSLSPSAGLAMIGLEPSEVLANLSVKNFIAGAVVAGAAPPSNTLLTRGPNASVETGGMYVWDYDANMAAIQAATGVGLYQRGPFRFIETAGVYVWDYDANMRALAGHLGIGLLTRGPLAFSIDARGVLTWDYDANMRAIQGAL